MKLSDEQKKLLYDFNDALMDIVVNNSHLTTNGISTNHARMYYDMCSLQKQMVAEFKKTNLMLGLMLQMMFFFKSIPIKIRLLQLDFQHEHYKKFIIASLIMYTLFFISAIMYIILLVMK